MTVQAKRSVYEQVVEVTQRYLGPAAERFVSRQIETHLKKSPEKLNQQDLILLNDWIKLAAGLLSNDHKQVNQYLSDLRAIAND